MIMKKNLMILMSAIVLLPAMATNNVAPWGWATCSDESGAAYTLNGGNFSNASTITLKALGDGKTDDTQIKQAIAKNDIIIFDGSMATSPLEKPLSCHLPKTRLSSESTMPGSAPSFSLPLTISPI